MKIVKKLCVFALSALATLPTMAQQTYEEIEQITVNEQVTTVITASEPIRFVDISTEKVVGDQPINNTIRLKPKENKHADGEILAIVTVVTERYRTQYALIYTTRMEEAVTDKVIQESEKTAYNNPAVSLSSALSCLKISLYSERDVIILYGSEHPFVTRSSISVPI